MRNKLPMQIRTGVRADSNVDTYRNESGYVQTRTCIQADTNRIRVDTDKDECKYKRKKYRY